MRRFVSITIILAVLSGCDKPRLDTPSDLVLTDISGSPTILLHVFGDRTNPRAVPVALIREDGFEPLVLDDGGWNVVDSMVFSAGTRLSVYHRGADIGTAIVERGMWSDDEGPLYTLPGCRSVIPQAELRLDVSASLEESIELLATNVPLRQLAAGRPLPTDAVAQGRTIASALAAASDIAPEELEMLDFSARWLHTGAGAQGRSLLVSYVDPNAGDAGPGVGHTSTVFGLAEDSANVFSTSFKHTAAGEARTVEFLRVINHADLDSNGVAEILLETWRYAATPELAILRYGDGEWSEVFRNTAEWCRDRR